MIVNVRLDITDEERSALSLLLHPKSPKRLATRQEFVDYCAAHVADLTRPQDDFVAPCADDQLPQEFFNGEEKEVAVAVVEDKGGMFGLRKLIHHVNCAMFSLSNAKRMAYTYSPLSLDPLTALTETIEGLRLDLGAEHDEHLETD